MEGLRKTKVKWRSEEERQNDMQVNHVSTGMPFFLTGSSILPQ